MKKIYFFVIAMLLCISGGIITWYFWQNENPYVIPEFQQDPYIQFESIEETEDISNYISWDDFTWNGPDATNDYMEEIGEKLLSGYSIDYTITPNNVSYEILRLTTPLYAMDINNRKIPEPELSKNLLFNNILCYTGRKNDLLIFMYSRFRPVIFKVISTERFYELGISELIHSIDQAYNFYYRNGSADTHRLQKVYDALCDKKNTEWITEKLVKIAQEENLPYTRYSDEDDEELTCEELLYAYSFWARRYAENNIPAVRAIIDDLRAHYMFDEERDFHVNALNYEEQPTDKNGDYIYFYYENNELECEYKYDTHGQRTGYWIQYFQNCKINECRMENDMMHGEYNVYNDGKLIQSFQFNTDLMVSGVYFDDSGNIEKSIRYEYQYDKIIEHIDMGNEGTVSSFIIDNQKEGPFTAKYPDGQVKIETNYSNGKIQGEYKKYYPSGKIQEISHYDNGYLQGIQQIYYEDGNIKSETNYQKGYKNGENKEYYLSGTIKSKNTYKNNNIEGEWIEYFESGQVKSESIIKNNRTIETKHYHPNGKLSSICKLGKDNKEIQCKGYDEDGNPDYENTKLENKLHGRAIVFYPSGKVKEECIFNNDKPQGNYRTFYEDGNPEWIIPYENGLRNGEASLFYISGKINKTVNYINGKLNGPEINYLESGMVESEITWQNDKRHGNYHLYYPSGNVKEKGNFKDNKPDGEFTYYKKNGKIDKKVIYIDGEIQK